MSYTVQQRQKAKSVDIAEFLAERGILPVKESGGELKYHSPFRQDSTPSFSVNIQKNCFKDFGDEEKRGDVITLCQLLDNVSYSRAMETLLRFKGGTVPISFEKPQIKNSEPKKVVIKKILPLYSQNLRNYFLIQRNLEESVVKRYLSEISYENERGSFYAGCWRNDAGGYELRSPKFKGCLGKKAPTTFIQSDEVDTLTVFEGYIDFLSWLSLLGKDAMSYTDVVVLNSLSLLTLDMMGKWRVHYDNVHLYFDNDTEGKKAVQKVRSVSMFQITDFSQTMYPNHKDLNEYLCQKHKVNANG